MRWYEGKETFESYASRLRSASMKLAHGSIDESTLLNRLRNGLTRRIQDQAALIPGGCDEVVSRLAALSTTQGYKENVRQVNEGTSETGRNRWANVRCHFCSELGHISRHCPKKRDEACEGKGSGGNQEPKKDSPQDAQN